MTKLIKQGHIPSKNRPISAELAVEMKKIVDEALLSYLEKNYKSLTEYKPTLMVEKLSESELKQLLLHEKVQSFMVRN